ncbi:MAG: LytTR family DNA-binding domain-containing protein [Bacteroidota bacterium]
MKKQLALSTTTGLKIINPLSIRYCKADGSYSHIYLEEGEKMTVSKNLKALEGKLPSEAFLRIHHKYLVNRYQIVEIFINGGCHVLLKDGTKLEVSQKKRPDVIGAFDKL